MEQNIKRIQEMEKILDEYSIILENFNESFDKLLKYQDRYAKLRDYYGSEEYFEDLDRSNAGELPSDLKCGVLSEDLVYNLIGDNFQTAIKMLELATQMIKED